MAGFDGGTDLLQAVASLGELLVLAERFRELCASPIEVGGEPLDVDERVAVHGFQAGGPVLQPGDEGGAGEFGGAEGELGSGTSVIASVRVTSPLVSRYRVAVMVKPAN